MHSRQGGGQPVLRRPVGSESGEMKNDREHTSMGVTCGLIQPATTPAKTLRDAEGVFVLWNVP